MKLKTGIFVLIMTISVYMLGLSEKAWASTKNESNIAGQWLGKITVGNNSMLVIFNISLDDNGGYMSTMDSPSQGAKGIPVTETTLVERTVVIDIKIAGATFAGVMDLDGKVINGHWSQSGQKFELVLSRKQIGFSGLWKGQLAETKTVLQIRILENDNGSFIGSISPDHGINEIAASKVTISVNKIILTVASEGVTYTGFLSENGEVIEGNFNQGSRDFNLSLKRTEDIVIPLVRPQEPKKPYPYISEEVILENKIAGINLAGTLTLPKRDKKSPAVILISGSGAQDRDQNWMGHKTFLVLADHLTRQGIAVLRFDDRGYGKSQGDFSKATSKDFATDVEAAIKFLKTRKEIAFNRIGLVGHSEGGLIAPIVAVNSPDVSFIVMMAGPGISGMEISVNQFESILKYNSVTDMSVKAAKKMYKKINISSIRDINIPTSEEELHRVYEKYWANLNSIVKKELTNLGGGKLAQKRVDSLRTPWSRYFLAHQPGDWLSQVKVPVLALHGSKDTQMNARLNLEGISKALSSAGNKNFKTIEIEGLNHLFQKAKTGLMSEYSEIAETISPRALTLMSEWILTLP